MSDEPTSKAGRTWLHVAIWLGSALLLYVLSLGPAAVLVERKLMSKAAAETVYVPVLWLMEQTNTDDAVEAYCEAWMRLTGTPVP
jgi:hypothetical protein